MSELICRGQLESAATLLSQAPVAARLLANRGDTSRLPVLGGLLMRAYQSGLLAVARPTMVVCKLNTNFALKRTSMGIKTQAGSRIATSQASKKTEFYIW